MSLQCFAVLLFLFNLYMYKYIYIEKSNYSFMHMREYGEREKQNRREDGFDITNLGLREKISFFS